MKKLTLTMTMLLIAMLMAAQSVQKEGNTVTIRPAEGQARVVRLQVVGDKIIRFSMVKVAN